jgi:hypothetical protein
MKPYIYFCSGFPGSFSLCSHGPLQLNWQPSIFAAQKLGFLFVHVENFKGKNLEMASVVSRFWSFLSSNMQ